MPKDDPGAPVPYIYNAISEGTSATAALAEYREAGGSIRTQRWYAAFGEIENELALRPNLQALPLDVVPGAGEVGSRQTFKPGGYQAVGGVLVSVRSIDPETGKVVERTQTNFGSLKMGSLRTSAEMLAELESKYGPEGQSGIERSTVLGSFLTAVNELVPYEEGDGFE